MASVASEAKSEWLRIDDRYDSHFLCENDLIYSLEQGETHRLSDIYE